MAQVSLYLDNDTFGKIETAAQLNGISISKYVAAIIHDHFNHKWRLIMPVCLVLYQMKRSSLTALKKS